MTLSDEICQLAAEEDNHWGDRQHFKKLCNLADAAQEMLTALNGVMGLLKQPITERLRKENSIFDGDMHVLEHFVLAAITKARGEA